MRYHLRFIWLSLLLTVTLIWIAPLHAQDPDPTKSIFSLVKTPPSIGELFDKLTEMPTADLNQVETTPTPAKNTINTALTSASADEATIEPTAEKKATPTAKPISFGTICINSFADDNASGIRDTDEGYMAGIPVTVKQAEKIVEQGVSTGTQQPVCFAELAPGEYEVSQQPPASLELTTAGTAVLNLKESQTIGLEFGSRVRPMPTDTLAPTESITTTPSILVPPVPESNELSPIVWITVLSVLVIGIGGGLIALLRR